MNKKRFVKTVTETRALGESLIRRHEEALATLRAQLLQLDFYGKLSEPTTQDIETLSRLRYNVQSGDWRQR